MEKCIKQLFQNMCFTLTKCKAIAIAFGLPFSLVQGPFHISQIIMILRLPVLERIICKRI